MNLSIIIKIKKFNIKLSKIYPINHLVYHNRIGFRKIGLKVSVIIAENIQIKKSDLIEEDIFN
jgi:hypothetical protein